MRGIQLLLNELRTILSVCTIKTALVFVCSIVVNVSLVLCSVLSPVVLMKVLDAESDIWVCFALIMGVLVSKSLCEYMNSIIEKLAQTEYVKVNCRLELLLAEKFTHIEYKYLQDTEFLNIHSGAEFALVNYKTVEHLMQAAVSIVCQSIVLLLGGGFLLLKFPVLVIFLAAGFVLQLLVNGKLNKTLEYYFDKLFPVNRRYRWLSSVKFDVSRQKDIRAYHMEKHIEKKMMKYNGESSALFGKMNRITCMYGCAADILENVMVFAGYVYNMMLLFGGELNLGLFLSLNTLLLRCSSILNNIGDSITTGSQMLNYMKPIVKALNYETFSGEGLCIEDIFSIEFKNVSFAYPGCEDAVLKNVSFSIKKGEKVGLVGLNGSGKSTIIKLLCGLYVPIQGRILINDTDITQLNLETYYRRLGVVFQDFNILDFSIRENILMSNDNEDNSLESVIDRVGLGSVIKGLKDGVDTKLGTQTNDDAINLSGGQLQKIAIARALYADKDVYIFDEPDSNIDSAAEKSLYQQYDRLTQEKSAIFVSHKLSSLSFCNRIILIENQSVKDLKVSESPLS